MSYQDDVSVSEGLRQSDITAALANFTGDDLPKAIKSADRSHLGRVLISAHTNSQPAGLALEAWRGFARADENHTATDTTSFHLEGGHYLVTATATWGGGTVTLVDSNSNVFATFTANGSATVDLRYGTYALTIDTATGVSVTVKTTPYVPAWSV